MTQIIIVGIILVILIALVIFTVCSNVVDKAPLIILLIGIIFLISVAFYYAIDNYLSPHHNIDPTIKDVPEQAHIDTIRTIRNGQESVSYEIVWNE